MAASNLIDDVFVQLRKQSRTALIPFVTIGDPDLDTSVEIIQALEDAGADMVELGVPYSDPLADGPVIQRASERALLNGSISVADVYSSCGERTQCWRQAPFHIIYVL